MLHAILIKDEEGEHDEEKIRSLKQKIQGGVENVGKNGEMVLREH